MINRTIIPPSTDPIAMALGSVEMNSKHTRHKILDYIFAADALAPNSLWLQMSKKLLFSQINIYMRFNWYKNSIT